jgi:hypothetical protein
MIEVGLSQRVRDCNENWSGRENNGSTKRAKIMKVR